MQIALTIAGSDSGGGAGIQADLKTFHQFGVFGTSVITAITAQNTLGVAAVHPVPERHVRTQIDAVAGDLSPHAFKSGMLATAALVETVGHAIVDHGLENYVLDPVMIATSGDRLLARDAELQIATRLLPLATLVTPNTDEAAVLTEQEVCDVAAMESAGADLIARGARAALIKGGHIEGETVVDVLVTAQAVRHFEHARIDTRSTHGTGCTLSAAVTASLALGHDLETSVERGLDFVHAAIVNAPSLGSGHGPLNHFVAPYESARIHDA
jgi:hydroxymethylpyrimidine/phosphomethylpyrimidine kinase